MKLKFKYIVSIVLLLSIVSCLEASAQSLILAQADSEAVSKEYKDKYLKIVAADATLKKLRDSEKFTVSNKKIDSKYIVKVDSFKSTEALVTTYLTLKNHFPDAFIMENIKNSNSKISDNIITKEIIVESDNTLSWIAIFSLATIGILALFVSSLQIRKINDKYIKMQEKQHNLELFLTQMGENIYTLTKEVIQDDSDSEIDENDEEQSNLNSVKNKLFDETRMMIYFLRLKSKKIKIIEENFNLNTMLSNILGTLSSNFSDSKTELIFDIDHNIPKIVSSDLLHLSEILIELLQNAMQNTIEGQVKLEIKLSGKDKIKFEISDTGIGIDDVKLENLFTPTYTDEGEYKGVGLYVSNELTNMMGGELSIDESSREGTTISCIIPLVDPNANEKRKYRLPDVSYVKKSVLLCENNGDAAKATKKMLNYFKYNVDIVTSQKPISKIVDISKYDMIMGDIANFDPVDIGIIQMTRKEKSLKVVNFSSAFSTANLHPFDYIDEWLKKPLSQERLRDLIIVLFDETGEKSVNAKAKNRVENTKIIHPKDLKKLSNINTDSFKIFSGKTILVVDDSFIDQKLFQNILERGGIKVLLEGNGKGALEKLYQKDQDIDLVLMDISMPVMDGYETIRHIRANDKFVNLPIIASTSMTLDSDIEKMFKVGANAYIGKPLNISYLYATLSHFLIEEDDARQDKSDKKEKNTRKEKVIQDIHGLDFKRGIKNANGSEELYLEVLNEFVLAYGESNDTIRRMVDENRYQQAKRLCLDMKGLTSAIGAYEMFDIVDSMHKQYLYNNVHLIPKFVETYNDGLVKLMKAIEDYRNL